MGNYRSGAGVPPRPVETLARALLHFGPGSSLVAPRNANESRCNVAGPERHPGGRRNAEQPVGESAQLVFDAYERHWPVSRPPEQILVIDIDGDSIRHVGQWPWPRDRLAQLVEVAATARVIGIDLLLTEPDRL